MAAAGLFASSLLSLSRKSLFFFMKLLAGFLIDCSICQSTFCAGTGASRNCGKEFVIFGLEDVFLLGLESLLRKNLGKQFNC